MIYLVLINGPSGSGKTSLANGISKFIKDQERSPNNTSCTETSKNDILHAQLEDHEHQEKTKTKLFHQDNYFTKPFLPYHKRTDDSYENDSGINWEKLKLDILETCMDYDYVHFHDDDDDDDDDDDQDNEKLDTNFVQKKNSCTNANSSNVNDKNANDSNKHSMILIVEGHVLSSKIISNHLSEFIHHILFITIKATKDSCRKRRLGRNLMRSEDEKHHLRLYYDTFVWPSYLKYGHEATESFQTFMDYVYKKKNSNHTVSKTSSCNTSTTCGCDSTTSTLSNKIMTKSRSVKFDVLEIWNEHVSDLRNSIDTVASFLMKHKWIMKTNE